MRIPLAPHGGIAVILGVTGCGHTEPPARGDAVALGLLATHPAAADASDSHESSATAPSLADVVDAAPEAAAFTVLADAGESDAPVERPTAHCLEDAGSPKRTLIRFVNRWMSGRDVPHGCQAEEFVLEIPSLGLARQLCASACGPFNFESHKTGAATATFQYANDFVIKVGTATVVDDVLYIDIHGQDFTGSPFASPPVKPRWRRAPEAIPLPCGTRAEIQTGGRWYWMGEGPVVRESSR